MKFLFNVAPQFEICIYLLWIIIVNLNMTVNLDIDAFQFVIFFHAVTPLFPCDHSGEVDRCRGCVYYAHHVEFR